MDFRSRLAARARALRPSPIRKLVPLMQQPGMISLGGGYPNPSTFAFDSVEIVFSDEQRVRLDRSDITSACQYGPTPGQAGLLSLLVDWHRHKDGVTLAPEQIQVLNGSQEGLHIAAYLLLERDDVVALSEPAYPGALGAFRGFCENFMTFPVDRDGSVVEVFERGLQARHERGERLPKFVYEVPNGHNPAGVALSTERRHQLMRIAERFDLLILEDDPYELVRLEPGAPRPTLQSLDTTGRVLRLDSFSKVFAPGLRIGYASGPAELIHGFELYKQTTNLHTSSMVQAMLAAYMQLHGPAAFRAQIERSCQVYRRNRDAMIEGARKHLPADVRFDVPTEGMFLWFRLPEGFDAARMVDTDGTDLGVLLVPGSAFSTCGGLRNCMRASFSMVEPDQIEEGMRRFGEMVRREMDRHRADRHG